MTDDQLNWKNQLYFGDNLSIMRDYIADESVDLIYLDPPFNSKATYNVLFHEKNGKDSPAQITAFEDTWHWDTSAEATYWEVVKEGPTKLADLLQALRQFLGSNDMLAYLTMMAVRLVEMRRVLKKTGSIYLHCDPTASHYLKLVMDAVFGVRNFRNEIIWKRTFAHGNVGRNFGSITDIIFWYTRNETYIWCQQYANLTAAQIEAKYPHVDTGGRRWQSVTLRNPGPRPNLHFPYTASNGVTYQPHRNGWSCNLERLQQYDREGRLHFPTKHDGALRLKMYSDESPGEKLQNVWVDIPPIGAQAAERLGYPTQKPELLLERIILSSSNEGAVVLDPFCGCGTTIAVAERLHRRWIGIDVTHLAITLMVRRLIDTFGEELSPFEIIGDPKDVGSADALAHQNRHQFEWWALSLVGARPAQDKKKGADKGVDGYVYFQDDESGQAKKIVVQVKSGHVHRQHIHELKGVMNREGAEIAALITLSEPTKPMKEEAISTGFYEPEHFPGKQYPRLQILTIDDLLREKELQYPRMAPESTFKAAKRQKKKTDEQGSLLDE